MNDPGASGQPASVTLAPPRRASLLTPCNGFIAHEILNYLFLPLRGMKAKVKYHRGMKAMERISRQPVSHPSVTGWCTPSGHEDKGEDITSEASVA